MNHGVLSDGCSVFLTATPKYPQILTMECSDSDGEGGGNCAEIKLVVMFERKVA